MTLTRPRTWTPALFFTALTLCASAPGPAPATNAERAAVRALLDHQVVDWNRKDLDAFLQGYWNNPGVVFQSGGTRSVGFEAMRKRYRERYQEGGHEMGTLAFSDLDVEVLASDAAYARGRWQLTLSSGERPGGLFTVILRKFPEGWRIVHDHTSSASP